MKHILKTWPEYFEEVVTGRKPFEVRRDDREFGVGDTLVLIEWDPVKEKHTGREASFEASYLLKGGQFGIKEGFCVMGLKPSPESESAKDEAGEETWPPRNYSDQEKAILAETAHKLREAGLNPGDLMDVRNVCDALMILKVAVSADLDARNKTLAVLERALSRKNGFVPIAVIEQLVGKSVR